MLQSSLVIDLAPLKTLSGNDPEFIREILEMISLQSPQLVEKINEEYSNESFYEMSRTAHKYKSSLQILGNSDLTNMAQEIEYLAATGHTTERLVELLDQMNNVCDQLLDLIQAELTALQVART